jgi:hypothetical protein
MKHPHLGGGSIFAAVVLLGLSACTAGGGAAAGPTEIGEPSSASTPTEPPPMSAGSCGNAYFPVVAGSTWSYSGTGVTGAYSFVDTLGDAGPDGFTLTADFGDVTRVQAWSCTPEGLVALDYPGSAADASVSSGSSALVMETTDVSGVTLPSDLAPGRTWMQTYQLQGQQTLPDGEVAPFTGTATYQATAGGIESVTVPAGTFDALRVERSLSMNGNIQLQGVDVPLVFSGEETVHFAEGVGMIRSDGTATLNGQPIENLLELTGFSVP